MHEEIWAQSWRWNKDLIWKCRINRAAKSAPWFHLWIVHRRAITRLYLSIRLWLNFCCPTCYYFYTYYWIICCNNIMYSTTLSNSKNWQTIQSSVLLEPMMTSKLTKSFLAKTEISPMLTYTLSFLNLSKSLPV